MTGERAKSAECVYLAPSPVRSQSVIGTLVASARRAADRRGCGLSLNTAGTGADQVVLLRPDSAPVAACFLNDRLARFGLAAAGTDLSLGQRGDPVRGAGIMGGTGRA